MRTLVLLGVPITLVLAAALAAGHQASAGSQGSSDVLPVALVATIESALGIDTVVLTGWIEVERSAPRLEGGRSVIDLTVVQADLVGGSRLGAVVVSERPDQGSLYASKGELRALPAASQFPASSYVDLYIDADAPDSSLGPLSLHNEEPFRLEPQQGGAGQPLVNEWPPYGVTFHFGSLLAAAGCVPLLNPDNSPPLGGFCVRELAMEVAPLLPSYSVAPGGPRRLHPAGILSLLPVEAAPGAGQPPFVRVPCSALGLVPDGCDGGEDGDQDDLDALSYGNDLEGEGQEALLSVGPGAQGRPGSGVEGQTICPGLSPEPEPDVFESALDGENSLLFDGNGPVGRCTPAFPLGFVEGFSVRDDLDALDARDPSTIDSDGDGIPESAVFFSLARGSPTLAELGLSAADVLWTIDGVSPTLFAPAAVLGLMPDDDIDGLCLAENGNHLLDAQDRLYISLAPGSPSLASIGAGPGDLLASTPLRVVARAASLGLTAVDDLDALSCGAITEGKVGDVNCDLAVDSVDAVLILQYNSHLIDALPCFGGADVDGNGGVDTVDAAVVLQYHAGLLTRLPLHEAGAGRR